MAKDDKAIEQEDFEDLDLDDDEDLEDIDEDDYEELDSEVFTYEIVDEDDEYEE